MLRRLFVYFSILIAFIGGSFAAHAADTASGADTFTLETTNGVFLINARTLEIKGGLKGKDIEPVALAVFDPDNAVLTFTSTLNVTGYQWSVKSGKRVFAISAKTEDEALVMSVSTAQTGAFPWPQSAGGEAITAYALPIFGEGKYVPADDPQWIEFLTTKADQYDMAALSLPIWSEMRKDTSLTGIIDPPYDTHLSFTQQNGKLMAGLFHDFNVLNTADAYVVRMSFGPKDPVHGAKLYRKFLQKKGRFTSLQQKATRNPNVRKLAGAPHIYLWERGPLKVEDITQWRKFVRMFADQYEDQNSFSHTIWQSIPNASRKEIRTALKEAQGKDGFVSAYNRQVFTRALNAALPIAVPVKPHTPLAGGHDPYAQLAWIETVRAQLLSEFPDCFTRPAQWGGGLSVGFVKTLQAASLETAWLGAENWNDVLWHPEAAQAAREAGYLLSAYDSYGSSHPTSLKNTWDTAQMGDEIFETAAFQKPDGTRVTGFAGRGVYVNPAAIKNYAFTRIRAVADATSFESYFLDVDATGETDADFSPTRQTSRRQVELALQERVALSAQTLNLVTGSEGGTAAFAQYLHYAHGMTTVPFKWTSADMKTNRKSKYHVGVYWPPEAPSIFFKSTPLPPQQKRLFFDPEFRLPLYQIALHDSLVTTHHWEYPSLKFSGEIDRTALLQMLYMIPPMYHLSAQTLKRDLPIIRDYMTEFAPVHSALYDQQMTAFEFLSTDRRVQTTSFANGVHIIANFDSVPREAPDGTRIPAMAAQITGLGAPRIVLDLETK